MSSDVRRSKRLRDDTLTCERCGVSFLWTIEEQRHADSPPEAPVFCPGCRRLTPQEGRERGLVKWYDPRKKYGFVVRQKADEIFVHRSQLIEQTRLREGDLVEFSVTTGEKGVMASDVRVLSRPDDD